MAGRVQVPRRILPRNCPRAGKGQIRHQRRVRGRIQGRRGGTDGRWRRFVVAPFGADQRVRGDGGRRRGYRQRQQEKGIGLSRRGGVQVARRGGRRLHVPERVGVREGETVERREDQGGGPHERKDGIGIGGTEREGSDTGRHGRIVGEGTEEGRRLRGGRRCPAVHLRGGGPGGSRQDRVLPPRRGGRMRVRQEAPARGHLRPRPLAQIRRARRRRLGRGRLREPTVVPVASVAGGIPQIGVDRYGRSAVEGERPERGESGGGVGGVEEAEGDGTEGDGRERDSPSNLGHDGEEHRRGEQLRFYSIREGGQRRGGGGGGTFAARQRRGEREDLQPRVPVDRRRESARTTGQRRG
mmetsp:Transcript_11385/g.33529  ORF Transcript_11385/g.33529 Transcript_11385/m.33529 type:complete len:355 (+) Transcript_11385:822-1886(+)